MRLASTVHQLEYTADKNDVIVGGPTNPQQNFTSIFVLRYTFVFKIVVQQTNGWMDRQAR